VDGNPYGYRIAHTLFPSLMQGNEAVDSLLAALTQVEQQAAALRLDAIVLIRGGGAQLDLDCFDDYRLAVKIAKCSLPLFTGIGHERDETIADLVAHSRLKTPTAVAEFILSIFREFEEGLGTCTQRLDWFTRAKFKEEAGKIQQLALHINGGIKNRLAREQQKLTGLVQRTQQSGKSLVKQEILRLNQQEIHLKKGLQRFFQLQGEKIDQLEGLSRQLDPKALLKKGYTRTESNGIPVHLLTLEIGDSLITHSSNQKISSTITKIEEK
jgi:exodeoxyribonuclease VII large subunit